LIDIRFRTPGKKLKREKVAVLAVTRRAEHGEVRAKSRSTDFADSADGKKESAVLNL
jgi:hypothetical protein